MRPSTGAAILLAALLAPQVAEAQIIRNQIYGSFETTYMLYGRVVDSRGMPGSSIVLVADLLNNKGYAAKSFKISTSCNGDFGAWWTDVGTIYHRAKVRVSIDEEENGYLLPPLSNETRVDPHFRRSDLTLTLDREWPHICQAADEYWTHRVTVSGRIVKGAPAFEDANGTKRSSQPLALWPVELNVTVGDDAWWPPDSPIPTDPRGDFQYSYVFKDNVTAGLARIAAQGKQMFLKIDPHTRYGVALLDVGDGRPPASRLPGPQLGLIAVALGAAAWTAASRRNAR